MADSGATLSYAELERQSNRSRTCSARAACAPVTTSPSSWRTGWSSSRSSGRPSAAGLFYTPVNWHLSADEAAYIVADCGARLLVSSSGLEEVAAAAAARRPRCGAG